MAKKQSVLMWTKEDEKILKKAVSDFNKKVKQLNKTRKDKSFIPSEIDYEASKDLITTRSELNRVLESLGRFKGKEAFKKVTLPSRWFINKMGIRWNKASAKAGWKKNKKENGRNQKRKSWIFFKEHETNAEMKNIDN